MSDFDMMAAVEAEMEDTLEGKFLTFTIGNEQYGIEIRHVTEIIGIQEVTDLPDVPYYVKGVINLRGKVIPVIDVRLRFGMDEREYDERTCIVVVNISNLVVGMIVDAVSEVMDIPADKIQPPAKLNQSSSTEFIQGFGKIDEEVKILLDAKQLLFAGDLEMMESMDV